MIRNKYKIEKKSALELKREEAAAKAAELRENAASTAADTAKSAAKTAVKAKVAAKAAPVALAGAAAGAAHVASEKATPLVETVAEKAAPVQEKAHEVLAESILPRLTEVLNHLAEAAQDKKVAVADAAPSSDEAKDNVADAAKAAAAFFSAKKAKDAMTSDDSDDDSHPVAKGLLGLAATKKVKDAVSNDEPKGRRAKKAAKAAAAAAAAKAAKDAKDAKKNKKKGKGGTGLMVLGLGLAAAAAGLTAYKQMQPKEDPWATPLLDPYVPPTSGRDATVSFSADATGTNADLTPAEVAQGGDATTILSPVENQHLAASATSTASELPTDDGAGQLLDDTASFERNDKGEVTGDSEPKTF